MPIIAPVLLFNVNPAGSAPRLMLKARVPAPPVAVTVWLYAVNSVSAGSVVVVITGGGLTTMLTEADLVVSATEVAVIVTEVFEVTVAGAAYVTGLPVVALNVPPPVTVQVTPLPDESLATVAAMLRVCPWSIACAALGDTVTEIAGGGGVLALEPHP